MHGSRIPVIANASCDPQVSVRFDYSPYGQNDWNPIDDASGGHTDATGLDASPPFFALWDTSTLPEGSYDVRIQGIHPNSAKW